MILLDTSGLLAALFPDQNHHPACASALAREAGPFVLSPMVLAEVDYLITRFAGTELELQFLADVGSESYQLAPFAADDVDRACEVIAQYADLGIGLTDASIVVLSERLGTRDLLTLDERHFRTLRGAGGKPFRILPADAQSSSP